MFNIQTLLFAAKWVFVGLIYFALLLVLVAVRREMALRLHAGQPLPSTAPGRLVVIEAGSDPQSRPGVILLLKPETTLGADPGSDLVLKDGFVSSHHARIRWDGAGWWLEDLGSKNGTYVNGERVPPGTTQKVALGSKLRLGAGTTAVESLAMSGSSRMLCG